MDNTDKKNVQLIMKMISDGDIDVSDDVKKRARRALFALNQTDIPVDSYVSILIHGGYSFNDATDDDRRYEGVMQVKAAEEMGVKMMRMGVFNRDKNIDGNNVKVKMSAYVLKKIV